MKISTVLDKIDEGAMALPEFQRGYVWNQAQFARDHGYDGLPFRWDAERRSLLRAELDPAFFHLPPRVARAVSS